MTWNCKIPISQSTLLNWQGVFFFNFTCLGRSGDVALDFTIPGREVKLTEAMLEVNPATVKLTAYRVKDKPANDKLTSDKTESNSTDFYDYDYGHEYDFPTGNDSKSTNESDSMSTNGSDSTTARGSVSVFQGGDYSLDSEEYDDLEEARFRII